MKKFLSLVLALVMTMSLVTISAGAKDFTDDSTINYKEAVDVMSAVKVIDGYADGSFNPQGGLTRGAAAKIICNMILGPTTASALVANNAPFKDVPADSTFAGYIAYCANEGIISGYADGTFRPSAPLTGYAFMKMLLGALGYDATIEGYTGTNWSVQVAKRALNIGLNKGLEGDFSGAKSLNREEACLYAFNTMKATMVEYDNNSKITVGDIVISNSSKAEKVKVGDADTNKIKADGYEQFAEKYFTKLKLVEKDQTDNYGRPAHVWYANNTKDKIGTYVDTPVLTYTAAVKGTVLADDLDDAGIEVAGVDLYRNDKEAFASLEKDDVKDILASKSEIEGTGKGILVEVYEDDDTLERIVVVATYLAEITNVTKDKTSTKSVDERTLTLKYTDVNGTEISVKADPDTAGFDDVYEACEQGDMVLVVPKGDNSKSKTALEVAVPETVEGVIEYSSNTSIDIADESYDFAKTLVEKPEASEKEVTVYLDQYGYVIGSTAKSTGDNKALALLDLFYGLNDDGEIVPKAKVVFSDGTKDTIEISEDSDLAPFCTYEKSKGVYTLTEVEPAEAKVTKEDAGATFAVSIDELAATAKKIETYQPDGDAAAVSSYFASDVTFIFVSYNEDAGDDPTALNGKYTVKEGVQKLAALNQGSYTAAVTIDKDGKVDTVFVIGKAANTVTTADSLLFVAKETGTVIKKNADGDYVTYRTFDAYIDGEKVDNFYSDVETDWDDMSWFYTVEVDEDTGAYVLDGNEYDDSNEDLKVEAVDFDADTINNDSYILADDVDLSKAAFIDNSSNEIESLADLKTAIDELDEGEVVETVVLYDEDTLEAVYVYILGID